MCRSLEYPTIFKTQFNVYSHYKNKIQRRHANVMNGKCFNWIDTMRMSQEFDSIRLNVLNQLGNDFTFFVNRMYPKDVNVWLYCSHN